MSPGSAAGMWVFLLWGLLAVWLVLVQLLMLPVQVLGLLLLPVERAAERLLLEQGRGGWELAHISRR